MTDRVHQWVDAPPCRECGATVVTPSRFSPHCSIHDPAFSMWCPACGAFWEESDVEVIAKAWWSRGAWDGHKYPKETP